MKTQLTREYVCHVSVCIEIGRPLEAPVENGTQTSPRFLSSGSDRHLLLFHELLPRIHMGVNLA